ncbi:hypothetical protein [Aquabacterium sp.]|uniref:hypothetical protein n=1 Tax=Aquabacterium sp. TaxID=1872578 RepID=UPI004037E54F
MSLEVLLTNQRTGAKTTVKARRPNHYAGIWSITERTRRDAFKRIGADWRDPNPGVASSSTIRAVDADGWHTFTLYRMEA